MTAYTPDAIRNLKSLAIKRCEERIHEASLQPLSLKKKWGAESAYSVTSSLKSRYGL